MTTNQTIDGVPREQLVRWEEMLRTPPGRQELLEELRALLDAPMCKTPSGAACPGDGVGSCKKCPGAQPQGELVGYAVKSELKAALADTSNKHFRLGLDHPAIWAEDTPYGHLVALYAEQPAPVAAVRMCDCNQGRLQCHGSCKP